MLPACTSESPQNKPRVAQDCSGESNRQIRWGTAQMWSACGGLSSWFEGSLTATVLGFSGTGGFSLSSIPFPEGFHREPAGVSYRSCCLREWPALFSHEGLVSIRCVFMYLRIQCEGSGSGEGRATEFSYLASFLVLLVKFKFCS